MHKSRKPTFRGDAMMPNFLPSPRDMIRLARTRDYHLPGLPDFGTGETISDGGIGGALWGTAGNDVFVVSDPNTRIFDWVGQGIDTVLLQTNRLNLEAFWPGSSFAQASGAIENVVGSADGVAFEITGNRFNNYLSGGQLGDTISGGYGTDILIGLDGDDSLVGGMRSDLRMGDSLYGGAGSDTVIGDATMENIWDDNDFLAGDAGRDSIFGGGGSDTLDGGADQDTLVGGAGSDLLIGGTGDDLMNGGAGNDTLMASFGGRDTLIGGDGADMYMLAPSAGKSRAREMDLIQDFNVADDTIMLVGSLGLGLTGSLDADAFHIGMRARDAEDRIIFNPGTGALLYDADGIGGMQAVQFATLTNIVGTVTHEDFVVV